jgi:hypothetical protein
MTESMSGREVADNIFGVDEEAASTGFHEGNETDEEIDVEAEAMFEQRLSQA